MFYRSLSVHTGGQGEVTPPWADTLIIQTPPRPGRHPLGRYSLGRQPLGRNPLADTPSPARWSCSGRYAFYWNAFLFCSKFGNHREDTKGKAREVYCQHILISAKEIKNSKNQQNDHTAVFFNSPELTSHTKHFSKT